MNSLSLNYRNFPKRYIRDPRLGHRLGKNFKPEKYVDEIWGHRWLGSGPNGFFGQYKEIFFQKSSSDIIRIMLLGGSAAMGLGATNSKNILANQVHLKLSRIFPKKKFEILNCAVGDYSSSQSLLALTTELIMYKPDIIVVLDGFNDFSHSSWGSKFSNGDWLANTTRSFDDCLFAIQKWENKGEEAVRNYARKMSRLGIIVGKILNRQHSVVTNKTHGMVWDNPKLWSIKESAISWYLENIIMLAGITWAQNIDLLHVVQPSILWTHSKPLTSIEERNTIVFRERMPKLDDLAPEYYNLLRPKYKELQKKLKARKAKNRIILENWAELLDQSTETLFTDPIHYSDLGQSYLGTMLVKTLATKGFIK